MKKFLLFNLLIVLTISLYADYESDFQTRKNGLINYMVTSKPAGTYVYVKNDVSDPLKHRGPQAVAFYEKYGMNNIYADSVVSYYINTGAFHFNVHGIIRLLMKYYDSSDTVKKYSKYYINNILTNFNTEDNYNAWTGEGTENHIGMSRCAGYLHMQLAKDKYPSDFPTAATKLAELKSWIMSYSKAIYSNGTAEYNSTQYNAYNIGPWLNLYDFATDTDVKNAAHAVLDFYATEAALHYSWGTLGGVEQRSSSGATDNSTNAGEYLGWLWFGGNTTTPPQGFAKEATQSIHAATSSYRPPLDLVALGEKTMATPIWLTMSRGSYLFEKKGHVKSFLYATQNYSIGSAATGYAGFSGGSYAQVDLKIIIKKASGFPYYISGNGYTVVSRDKYGVLMGGKATNPFTQYVQHQNVAMMLTYTPTDWQTIFDKVRQVGGVATGNSTAVAGTWQKKWYDDFKSRFPTGFVAGDPNKNTVNMQAYNTTNPQYSYLSFTGGTSAYAYSGKYMVVKYNNAYIAVRFFNSNAPTTAPSARGAIYDQNASLGKLTGFIIEMADASEYASASAYLTNFMTRSTTIDINGGEVTYTMKDGTVLNAKYDANGTFHEALYDWGFGPTTQQTKLHSDHVTPTAFQQPDWTSYTELNNKTGRFPIFKINSVAKDLKATTWPVIDANSILLNNQKLTIGTYSVDYSGLVPVWEGSSSIAQNDINEVNNGVYPNPTNGILFIKNANNADCIVYDVVGKQVFATKTNGVIDITSLAKGIYVVYVNGVGYKIVKE